MRTPFSLFLPILLAAGLSDPSKPPEPPPERFLGLIGEYGGEGRVIIIREEGGRLQAQFGRSVLLTLNELGNDGYESPANLGPFGGRAIIFRRGPTGRATGMIVDEKSFPRRAIDGDDGQTFRIKPTREVDAIRREVDGLKPPAEPGKTRSADLVDLAVFVPGVKLDVRYATSNNFLGVPLYTSARALMQRPAAEALARVQAGLAAEGFGLLIHDAYRPWRVTKLFWEATPEAQHAFVADPAKGSKHNRGCAVDLTLCDRATGKPIAMVGGYDEFSGRSNPDYPGGTARQRWHRDRLRRAMEAEGFAVNEGEWWHFDFKDWDAYPILDVPFESLPPAKAAP